MDRQRSWVRHVRMILLGVAISSAGCFAEDPEKLWISEAPSGTPPECILPVSEAGTGSDAAVSDHCPQRSDPAEQSLVYFRNNFTDRTIDVNWVSFQCVEEPALQDIGPGEQQQTITYVTHVWRVRDSDTSELLTEIIIEDVSPGRVFEVGP